MTTGDTTTANPSDPLMCEQCFDAVELGMVIPGASLIRRSDGVFVLLRSPGHRGEELVVFDEAPIPDPVPAAMLDASEAAQDRGDPDPVSDEQWAASEAWIEAAEAAFAGLAGKLGLTGAHWLVEEMIEVGYDERAHGHAPFWLYNRCGELAATAVCDRGAAGRAEPR